MTDDVAFYRQTLEKLLSAGEIATTDKVVVFCGGYNDAKVLGDLGFSQVTITNVDAGNEGNIRGLAWESQDAENPTYPDGAFDVAVVHAGLHHCHSPHRALLQMYRVAAKVVVAFEARDSISMRLAEAAGFTPKFELEAISEDGRTGGVANGPVPNFIYRWTEREVEKTVRSFDPGHVERIRYFYGLRLPAMRFEKTGASAKGLALRLLAPLARAFWRVFPRQGNQFGFAIIKTGRLRDWMEESDGHLRLARRG